MGAKFFKKIPKKHTKHTNTLEDNAKAPIKLPQERKPKKAKKPLKKKDPFYSSVEWRKKRVEIIQRDEYTCQICGRTKGDLTEDGKRVILTVDHIIPRNERPDLALDNDNLKCICRFCHEGLTAIYNKEISESELEVNFEVDDYKEFM